MTERVRVLCGEREDIGLVCLLSGESFASQWSATWTENLTGEEDADWDWPHFLATECSLANGFVHYGLVIDGVWQAVMIVRPGAEMRAGGPGARGVYIEYLATAPWNRPAVLAHSHRKFERPRVKPLGKWLVWMAVRLSRERGTEGRVAWHSLAGAAADYCAMIRGLEDLGPDADENGLPWMEISSATAAAFENEMVLEESGVYKATGGGGHVGHR